MKEKHRKKKKKNRKQEQQEELSVEARADIEEPKVQENPAPVIESRPRRLARITEACQYASISRTKLYAKLNANVIKAYKRDGQTLIDLNSLDEMNAELPAYVSPNKRKF